MKRALAVFALGFLFQGCGSHPVDQLCKDLADGEGARFSNGELDGYKMYGFDAAWLHGKIVNLFEERKTVFKKMPNESFLRTFPLVYFVSLKYDEGDYLGIKRRLPECFRLQYGAIEHPKPEEFNQGWTSRDRCFTFFMVTESDKVYALSINLAQNLVSGHWTQGQQFIYGAVDAPVSIWDTSLPDRNSPEQILTQHYKEVFAVYTERPFNYLCYNNISRLDNFRKLRGDSVLRLCWSTPKCMVFIPEYLLQ